MKRLQGIIIGAALCLCLAAVAPVKKYWQDQIIKPDQAWIEAYGYNGESVLAYNVKQLVLASNRHDAAIRRMAAEMLAMNKELTDPNEPGDPNEP